MDRGTWQATVHGVARVRHDLATKPPPPPFKIKKKITSVGEKVEKLEPLCTVDGNIKSSSLYGKSIAVPQKIKNTSTIQSSKSTFRYMLKRIESKISKKYLCTHVHNGNPL